MAVLSDTCNYFDSCNNNRDDKNQNKPSQEPIKLIACLNSDRLPIPENLNHLLENYVNVIGTIAKKKGNDGTDNSTKTMTKTMSTWAMVLEHDPWLDSSSGYAHTMNPSHGSTSKVNVSFSIGRSVDDGSGKSMDDYEYEDDEPNAICWVTV